MVTSLDSGTDAMGSHQRTTSEDNLIYLKKGHLVIVCRSGARLDAGREGGKQLLWSREMIVIIWIEEVIITGKKWPF